MTSAGLEELSVTAVHADATDRVHLPHRDPFDRLLVAQAIVERVTLLTADATLVEHYGDHTSDGRR